MSILSNSDFSGYACAVHVLQHLCKQGFIVLSKTSADQAENNKQDEWIYCRQVQARHRDLVQGTTSKVDEPKAIK
jgi:hypothetical protein